MSIANGKFFYLAVLAAVGLIMTGKAWAHRDRGPDDPCRRQIGASLLHLTLYQPQFDPDAEYCEEVPRAGKTVVVVDVTAGELRQTPMSLEVVATADSGQSHTVLTLPAKVYEMGVADTEVVLNENGDYVARVVVEMAGKEPQLLSFPIHVAAWYRAMVMPAFVVAGVLVLLAISVIRYRYVSTGEVESSVGRKKVRRVAK